MSTTTTSTLTTTTFIFYLDSNMINNEFRSKNGLLILANADNRFSAVAFRESTLTTKRVLNK